MIREKILALKPGVDLNLKVAEEVMENAVIMDDHLGWLERPKTSQGNIVWSALQKYSEDLSAADMIIERMSKLGFKDTERWAYFGNGKYTEAEAICKAALVAVMEKRRIEKVSDAILEKALGNDANKSE
jgi:hypothetical protein